MTSQQPDYLFIYGTLHPDRAPLSIAAAAKLLKPVGKATILGRLYDLQEYPGVILSTDPGEIVAGELFLLPDGPATAEILGRLDAYEDYRPDEPENSLFHRQTTTATMEDGSRLQCWIYTYHVRISQSLTSD